MKKFSLFLSLMAFLLIPATLMAEQIYPTLSWVDENGNQVRKVETDINEAFTPPSLTCDIPEVLRSVTYSSTNEAVATMETYTGGLTLIGAGTATITAYFAGNDEYAAARAMYNLIVTEEKIPIETSCPDARFFLDGAEITSMTLKVGDVVSSPLLIGGDGYVYSARCTLDNKYGVFAAKFGENDAIEALAAGKTLYVAELNIEGDDGTTIQCEYTFEITIEASDQPTCPDAHFNLPADNVLHMTVGEVVSIPELLGGAGSILPLSAKTVENIRVAELTEDDQILATAAGQASFIGLYVQRNTDGTTTNCEYTFDIEVSGAVQEKADPELSLQVSDVNVEFGEIVVVPAILNPHKIEFTPNNSKWYTNWDSKVAQVDEATGEVTILGVGDEIITFEFVGNDEYKAAILSYTLHVSTTGLLIGDIVVRESNRDDVLGDGGSVVYDPITHTLTLTNATINQENFYHAPAHHRIAKTEPRMDAAIYYEDKAPLTIELIGANAILGFPAAILSESAPVVILSPEGAYGVARLSGQVVAIKAEALKLFKCDVTASSAVAIAVNELSVATGAHLLAYGESFAIQANSLILAEDHDGEGIAILTEGVTFEKGKGFFQDGKMATIVEIGKAVIPVPEDEVTTIDFTQTDPEGNESVLFSADVNNVYNEESGQLEISTSLDDETVAEALESLIPGSSAWVEALPGSILLDIPAGEGEMLIQCLTLPGYTLQVKLEGAEVVSITQASFGWAKVSYNVPTPIHVVIYLHAESSAGKPARIAASLKDEDPTVGAYIQAIEIKPAKAPQAIDIINAAEGKNAKVLINGQLYIVREGKAFTATGIEVR